MRRRRQLRTAAIGVDGEILIGQSATGGIRSSGAVTDEAVPVDRLAYGHIADRLESLRTRRFASGRRAAVEALDCLLGDRDNIQKLYEDLQELFDANPAEFLLTLARPFISSGMIETAGQSLASRKDGETEQAVAVRTLMSTITLAFQTNNPGAVVAARRELNLLQGLYTDGADTTTAELLRREMLAMQRTITGGAGGDNGNGRRSRLVNVRDTG